MDRTWYEEKKNHVCKIKWNKSMQMGKQERAKKKTSNQMWKNAIRVAVHTYQRIITIERTIRWIVILNGEGNLMKKKTEWMMVKKNQFGMKKSVRYGMRQLPLSWLCKSFPSSSASLLRLYFFHSIHIDGLYLFLLKQQSITNALTI